MVSSVGPINASVVSDNSGLALRKGNILCMRPSFNADYYECSYVPQEKKGSLLGFVAKTLLGAAAIAGGLVAARKFIPALGKDIIKEGQKLGKDAKRFDKVKHYTAKAADFIENNVKKAYNFCKDKIKSLKKDTPEETKTKKTKSKDK